MSRPRFIRAALLIAALLLPAVSSAQAQGPAARLRGQIARVQGDLLTVKSADGKIVTVALTPDATVTLVVPARLTDIKPGRFVGTAARPEANNRWRAIEVHIFPLGSHLGEGHRPWQPEPGATMTNADVTAVVVHGKDGAITLTTGGQSFDIDVPKGTPIVAIRPGTRKLLVKRAEVTVNQAIAGADGTLSAKSITVSKARSWPPK